MQERSKMKQLQRNKCNYFEPVKNLILNDFRGKSCFIDKLSTVVDDIAKLKTEATEESS